MTNQRFLRATVKRRQGLDSAQPVFGKKEPERYVTFLASQPELFHALGMFEP